MGQIETWENKKKWTTFTEITIASIKITLIWTKWKNHFKAKANLSRFNKKQKISITSGMILKSRPIKNITWPRRKKKFLSRTKITLTRTRMNKNPLPIAFWNSLTLIRRKKHLTSHSLTNLSRANNWHLAKGLHKLLMKNHINSNSNNNKNLRICMTRALILWWKQPKIKLSMKKYLIICKIIRKRMRY